MTTRRGHGDGSLFFDEGRQRWVCVLDLGRDGSGRRRRVKASGRTRAEARRRLGELSAQAEAGLAVTATRLTVGQWLDQWLATLPGRVADSTEASYRDSVRLHLRPALGGHKLTKLAVTDCDALWSVKLADGYAPNYVRIMRATLRRALGAAERQGLIVRNVAALSAPIRLTRSEGRSLTVEQARLLLDTAATDRLGAAYVLALGYGLRRGELLGLAWADWNTDVATLAVRQAVKRPRGGRGLVVAELKTARSRRTLHLTAAATEALRTHRQRQLAERLAAGPAWNDSGLVFTSSVGTAVDPDNFTKDMSRLTRAAGLGHWHPHELRHSAASLMLAAGVPLHVVADVLGHASIALTRDTYGHLVAGEQRVAAEALADVLKAPARQRLAPS